MLGLVSSLKTQVIGDFVEDESRLYAETKQVNQFFRRFNNEEGPDGIRYPVRSKDYRNAEARNTYLNILFNLENPGLTDELKQGFINYVNNDTTPLFLSFHAGDWFAEVKTKFLYRGKPSYITFFMVLEQENMGYKWVINNVYFDEYAQILEETSVGPDKFLHPLSHELDFMNFIRVFDDKKHIEEYTSKGFSSDYLSIFIYEFKQGIFEYQTVMDLKFHFFQIPGWYFELQKFNRSGYNTGWLISNLAPISEEEKSVLMKHIIHD
jgi:hypothetical protein